MTDHQPLLVSAKFIFSTCRVQQVFANYQNNLAICFCFRPDYSLSQFARLLYVARLSINIAFLLVGFLPTQDETHMMLVMSAIAYIYCLTGNAEEGSDMFVLLLEYILCMSLDFCFSLNPH